MAPSSQSPTRGPRSTAKRASRCGGAAVVWGFLFWWCLLSDLRVEGWVGQMRAGGGEGLKLAAVEGRLLNGDLSSGCTCSVTCDVPCVGCRGGQDVQGGSNLSKLAAMAGGVATSAVLGPAQ